MLNDLIKWVYEQGLSGTVYFGFHIVGVVVSLLFNLWYCKKYNIGRVKGFFITVVQNVIDYLMMVTYAWVLSGFTRFGGGNAVRVSVFIPFTLILVAKLFQTDWKRAWDFLAPSTAIYFGIGKLGCVFAGCCEGHLSSWGTYNIHYEAITFPVAALEAFVSIGIAIVLIVRAVEKKYIADGLSFPIYLVLFGVTRFILEFARNNEKLWLGCSDFAFHALFMAVVGVITYVIIKRHNSAKPEIAEEALLNSENN